MISLHVRDKGKAAPSEPERPKSTIPKSVKVNPVDYLKYRDFNNKYCFGVHAIKARGTSADQITQALSTTNSRDVDTERTSLVDSALDEWALLSTAGLSDVPLDCLDKMRQCRFQSAIFVPTDNLTFKAEFQWLITNRMGVVWTQTSRKNLFYAEKWLAKMSKGLFTHNLPRECSNPIILATALQFKEEINRTFGLLDLLGFRIPGRWTQPLEFYGHSKGSFEVSPTSRVDIPMLRVTTKIIYYKDAKKGFHLVGIPLQVNMTFVQLRNRILP
ncbi:unnamed protein product [Hydatigera taeniaeformis]|uniref:Nucleotid_trans domain-containing protein n=1 Tax=Hydatigena taeniaeformis TaxID=6205 RepID=A0A0R3XCJ3_HYDTA|nr:unnamed protein product [Hydatigera taeniaeformis]